MTYADVPSVQLIQKVMSTSFETPGQNKSVFDWCEKMTQLATFKENERVKLVKKYGELNDGVMKVKLCNMESFSNGFKLLLETEIEDFPYFPLSLDAFDDEKCCYPPEKELWISAKELKEIGKTIRAGE